MEKILIKGTLLRLFVLVAYLGIFLPTAEGSNSHLSNQPGLEFKPEPPKEFYERTLIWFNHTNYMTYVDALNDFLKEYKTPPATSTKIEACDYDHPASEGSRCDVDVRSFGPCSPENYYGYYRSQPCVFLKLKNIPNWIPEYYNRSLDLPEIMPTHLKDHIARLEEKPKWLNTVWVSCEGETPADVEFIGPVSYHPMRGFPGYYFPMKNEGEYLSPLIAVRFERARIGIIINVECKMWARNISHDRDKLEGLVRFQLIID